MTPEEFDINFDFDKEYGYNPEPGRNDLDPDDDFDLDAALARELGPDFDALFEKEYAAAQAALNAELAREPEVPEAPAEEEVDLDSTRFFSGFEDLDDEEPEQPQADEPTEDLTDLFSAAIMAQTAAAAAAAEPEAPAEEAPRMVRRERRQRPKGINLGAITEKVDLKGMGEKAAGMGHTIAENSKSFFSALKEIKPGKMDKQAKRRFKNDVLPFLIGGAAFVLCLIFIIGSLSRNTYFEDRQQAAREESIAQAQAEAEAKAEIEKVLDSAAARASEYDYQGAIDTLDGYKNADRELTEEMTAARAAYTEAMANLVVWDDPAAITNLSFHLLIADPQRAYADANYANSYRKNFVTTDQFSEILQQLYNNGYVLVNLESCIDETTDEDGNTTYTTKPIYLPEGKTPIMITETLVNYFDYMIDSDNDGTPDAGGAGFASRLVIDSGEVKAEYVDAQGQTQVGDYDLVPILNSFIDAHPDFSYRGAKAILAVTGDEGVFGWRTNSDSSLADGAKDVVEVLRSNGYQIACNSYSNINYGSTSLSEIRSELSRWTQEITPILGEVDIMVIARGGSIDVPETLGGGTRFDALHENGFRYIIDAASEPTGSLNADFFYQGRLMVVGSELDSSIYDAYFSSSGDTSDAE